MVAVLAVLALLALLVWYQSTGISARQRWRAGMLGQIAPEAPFPKGPVDPDARFALVPRRRIVVPAVSAGMLVVAGVVLLLAGLEPLAVAALVIGALEAGAALAAMRRSREALEFLAEQLRDGRGSGSGPSGGSP